MPELFKLPKPIYDQNHPESGLVAGDIVIHYQNPHSGDIVGNLISTSFQTLLNERGGHNNAEHAAIVVEVDGKLKLAHLLKHGFVLDDLNNKRTKHVYRIKNDADRLAIGKELNKLVTLKNTFFKEKIIWRRHLSLVIFIYQILNSIGIRNSSLVKKPKPTQSPSMNTNANCTIFVVDFMREGIFHVNANENLVESYMNINSMTAPKTLQAYLERNLNYEAFIVPQTGNKLYKKLIDMIPVTTETTAIHEAIKKFESDFCDDNDYEKTRKLMQSINPLLIKHAKLGKTLKIMLESQGLHSEYFQQGNVVETPQNISQWLQKINYNADEIEMYHLFRKRGLSDTEAQFSIRPTLAQWFALNPIRVTLVSLILPVIGLLAALAVGYVIVVNLKADRDAFKKPSHKNSTAANASQASVPLKAPVFSKLLAPASDGLSSQQQSQYVQTFTN